MPGARPVDSSEHTAGRWPCFPQARRGHSASRISISPPNRRRPRPSEGSPQRFGRLRQTIAALVENEQSPAVEQWRALAEIDENLIRRDLTAAQRAKLVAKRKAAYEAGYPDTSVLPRSTRAKARVSFGPCRQIDVWK